MSPVGRVSVEAQLFAFLAREFQPTPQRLRATLRFLVVAEIAILICMSIRAAETHWVLISIMMVSLADPQASVDKAFQRALGTVAGAAVGIALSAALWDLAGVLLVAIAASVAIGIYFFRTQPAAYFWLMTAVTLVLVMPDRIIDPDASIETGIWRATLTLAGVAAALLGQALLWPEHPAVRLREELRERLARMAAAVNRLVDDDRRNHPTAVREVLAITPLGRFHERIADDPHLEGVDDAVRRLIIGLRRLEIDRYDHPFNDEERTCLFQIEAKLNDLSQDRPTITGAAPTPGYVNSSIRPVIIDLCQSVDDLAMRLIELRKLVATPISKLPLPSPVRYVRPTRFNLAALQSGLKAGLALTVCGVLYQILLWPGIATCAVTCVTIAQPTQGASLFKAALRIGGAIAGTTLAFLALATITPTQNGIVGLTLAVVPMLVFAGYLAFGSARIGYAGIQTMMPAAMVLVDNIGLPTGVETALNRVAGIFIGIIVMTAIDALIWPRSARADAAARLDSAEQHIAGLEPLSLADQRRKDRAAHARSDLAAAATALEDARLEPGADDRAREERHSLLARLHDLETRMVMASAHAH